MVKKSKQETGCLTYRLLNGWSNPNIEIELSEEDVAVALKNRAIKNGFILASFNNTGLKELLIEKETKK